MKVYKNWTDTGINLRGKVSGQVKCKCPECPPDRGNKTDYSLSVNIDKKVWNCHYCQWKGGLTTGENEVKKFYKKPVFTPETPNEKMCTWFLKYRGIERKTLERFCISPIQKYIHKAGKVVDCIAFPYIKNTEIVNIKSRYDYLEEGQHKKTFTLEAEAELTFYNIDAIQDVTHCVIVEGEVDCLAVWQATGQPCVSVPNGASKGDQKLEYLENAYQYFNNKTMIVLATDNDAPGLALREELARRLGKDRCYFVEYPADCKDMNEVLLKHGPEYMDEMFQALHTFPMEGVITFESVEAEFDHYYEHGYPTGCGIGLPEFDNLLTFRGGEVTTLTGIPGHGKSEWLDEVLVRLATRHNWRHGLFAAENGSAALHYTRIAHRYIGKPFHGKYYKMPVEDKERSKPFMQEHFFFINRKEVQTNIDSLLEKAREMVLRKGINSFVIDPYNCMESNRPPNVNETEYVSQIYDKMVTFAELYNVHMFLVAHPTKLKKNEKTGRYDIPTMYSISGSANFYNKTYNGIAVYRDFQAQITTVYVQKVKFDFIGRVGWANFTYNYDKRQYQECVPLLEDEPTL
jgi:twinkle protein